MENDPLEKQTLTCKVGHSFDLDGEDARPPEVIASLAPCPIGEEEGKPCGALLIWKHYTLNPRGVFGHKPLDKSKVID